MKKLIAWLTACALLISCASFGMAEEATFRGMNDRNVRSYIEDTLYSELVQGLDGTDYYVSEVSTVYISQEYIDELEYNSQSNVYFGYTLEELDARFEGQRYVFTLGEDGTTVVRQFEAYDDTYERVIRNVAIGSGVILVSVVVSCATAGAAPAISMIFAVAAETGAEAAVSGAVLGALSSGVIKAIETGGDMDEVVKTAMLGGSESFKWGAISGAIAGASSEALGLYRVTQALHSELTMNDVAVIQRESGLPLEFIRYMHSMDEYSVYRDAGLKPMDLNGQLVYSQNINLDYVDKASGMTNAELIMNGRAPVDSQGIPYELHHIGQSNDSPFAILTRDQHRSSDTFGKLHFNTGDAVSDVDHGAEFTKVKKEVWSEYLDVMKDSSFEKAIFEAGTSFWSTTYTMAETAIEHIL